MSNLWIVNAGVSHNQRKNLKRASKKECKSYVRVTVHQFAIIEDETSQQSQTRRSVQSSNIDELFWDDFPEIDEKADVYGNSYENL